MDIKFTFVDNSKKLIEVCAELKNEEILGIDIECENNLHYYGIQVALIQISSKTKNYLIDAVTLKDMGPLVKLFENKNIIKIFHDVSFDLRMLKHDYDCDVKNVYDTQLAAAFLGKTQLGLGNLLEEYFNISKESKFQMANWVKRPISEAMLEYAIKDTVYLIKLHKLLNKELRELKRLDWVNEELKNFEKKDWKYTQGNFLDIRGIKAITDNERGIAKAIYKVRDHLAKKINRPIHFLFNNKRLIEFSVKPVKLLKKWQHLHGVHPIVKQRGKEFLVATLTGAKNPLTKPNVERKRYSQKQIEKFAELNEIKEKIAAKIKLPRHLLLNKENEKTIVLEGNFNCLSSWQRKLIEKEIKN